MQHTIHLHFAHTALIIVIGTAVSLITSTAVASRAYRQRGEQEVRRQQTITVKGSTRQRISSDQAIWNIHVSGKGESLQSAFAVLEQSVLCVKDFLYRMGFLPDQIGMAAIDTSTNYTRDSRGNTTDQISSYTLSRSFTVATDEVRRVRDSAGRVTELIKDGVHVISGTPRYYYTKLPELKIELMAAASADARLRADNIASATGAALGELRDARMGVLQITRPLSTEVSSWGIYDTDTIEKDVRAVVTATFGIAPT